MVNVQGLWAIWNLHFLIISIYMWNFIVLYLSSHCYFFTYFCLRISEEDALLVKYISCKFCIFLRSTGKHDMCSAQKSDIVWGDIFRSYCSFTQHGEQNPTEVLRFLFYISHLKYNYTKMQMILFIDYSWTFLSFSISIFYSLYMLSLTHRYGSLYTRTDSLESLV